MVGAGRVSLVIVNYSTMDRAEALIETSRDGYDEVIVVDNDSFRGDRSGPEGRHPGARFLWLGSNRGYGAGANAGASLATGDVLVVSNADIEISGTALRRLAAEVAGGGASLAAPLFVAPDGGVIRSSHRRFPFLLATLREYCAPFGAVAERVRPGWHPTLRPSRDHLAGHDAENVLGAMMAVDAETFRRVGGFDEGFFLYREETDLCLRVRRDGGTVRHVAAATATHAGDASSSGERRPVAVRPAAVRSHYRFIAKHKGRLTAGAAWLTGIVGGMIWLAVGPDRSVAAESLRQHRVLLRRAARTGA